MGQVSIGVWVLAAILSLMKGRGKLVAVSLVGGVLSWAILFGAYVSAAFTGYYDTSGGAELAIYLASLGIVWAWTAPLLASMRLAKPWSSWARANYDRATLRLATGRFLAEADRRGWRQPAVEAAAVIAAATEPGGGP